MTLSLRLLLLSSVVCAAGTACTPAAPEEVETEMIVPVTAEAATLGSVRAVIHATGLVTPAPGAELIVIAPEPARIVEIPKAEGDAVRRGDLLARFEIPSLSADAAAKTAEVAAAEARVTNALTAQVRARELFERGVAARKEVEDGDRAVAEAEAALEQARAARGAAQTLAGRMTVRAAFDGVVARRFHNPGELVEASATDPILRVIDPRRLQVDASVSIGDISRVIVGASARLAGGAAGQPVSMKVVSRPSAVEPGAAAAIVRLAFVAAATQPAGTPVQVEIDAEQHTGVVVVPAPAIVHEGDETAVFVASANKAQRRAVETGLSDSEHVEVRSGIKAGELVITHGQAGLPDGAAITLQK